jgi:hypothetical protein
MTNAGSAMRYNVAFAEAAQNPALLRFNPTHITQLEFAEAGTADRILIHRWAETPSVFATADRSRRANRLGSELRRREAGRRRVEIWRVTPESTTDHSLGSAPNDFPKAPPTRVAPFQHPKGPRTTRPLFASRPPADKCNQCSPLLRPGARRF